jgi:hypothetical protein
MHRSKEIRWSRERGNGRVWRSDATAVITGGIASPSGAVQCYT